MIGLRLLSGKNGKRRAEAFHQIDVDILTALPDRRLPVQSPNIPDAVSNPDYSYPTRSTGG